MLICLRKKSAPAVDVMLPGAVLLASDLSAARDRNQGSVDAIGHQCFTHPPPPLRQVP